MSLGVWDLSHLYSSNEDFFADFEKLKQELEKLAAFKGKLKQENAYLILMYFQL